MESLRHLIDRYKMFQINLKSFEDKYPPGSKRGEIFLRTKKYYKRTLESLKNNIINFGTKHEVYRIKAKLKSVEGLEEVYEVTLVGVSQEDIRDWLEFNTGREIIDLLIIPIEIGKLKKLS